MRILHLTLTFILIILISNDVESRGSYARSGSRPSSSRFGSSRFGSSRYGTSRFGSSRAGSTRYTPSRSRGTVRRIGSAIGRSRIGSTLRKAKPVIGRLRSRIGSTLRRTKPATGRLRSRIDPKTLKLLSKLAKRRKYKHRKYSARPFPMFPSYYDRVGEDVCINMNSYDGYILGKFKCPIEGFDRDELYCCGPKNEEYCCTLREQNEEMFEY
ncbi:hypothetical protein SNEBB_005337 [Seison nebaliae]|nr:hypothetical protein SNEBB_005337 [Seison nebaliae]